MKRKVILMKGIEMALMQKKWKAKKKKRKNEKSK
jgi:hypothetical protein